MVFGFRWTASTRADNANGLNRVSLSGLDVEKKDGEGTTPQSGKIDILECGMKNFFDCVFFDEESFGQVSSSGLQLSGCFCRCFQ